MEDNKDARRAQEDSEIREKRTGEDWEAAARVDAALPPRMSWMRKFILGAVHGILVAAFVLAALIAIRSVIPPSLLEREVARNAEITVAAEKALRCILNVPDLPERGPERHKVFDRCYRDFDQLVGEQ